MALDAINVENMPQVNIFFGFSGPTGRPGGFDVWARRAGAVAGFKVSVEMCDIINGTDLADEPARSLPRTVTRHHCGPRLAAPSLWRDIFQADLQFFVGTLVSIFTDWPISSRLTRNA